MVTLPGPCRVRLRGGLVGAPIWSPAVNSPCLFKDISGRALESSSYVVAMRVAFPFVAPLLFVMVV